MRRRWRRNSRWRTSRSILSAARGCFTVCRANRGRWPRRRLDLAFGRDMRTFTNLLINELPRGDFAFTMVRQFLVDAFNVPFLDRARRLGDLPGRHRREGGEGIPLSPATQPRLGVAVGRRHRREPRCGRSAPRRVMGLYARDVRAVRRGGAATATGVAANRASFEPAWRDEVAQRLRSHAAGAGRDWSVRGGRDGVHTEHLGYLLAEMQFMQRAYPGQKW